MRETVTYKQLQRLISESIRKRLNESELDGYDDEPTYTAEVLYNVDNKTVYDRQTDEPGLWMKIILKSTDLKSSPSGIGHYEFWGQSGYDDKTDYEVRDFEITDYEFYDYVGPDEETYFDDYQLTPEDEKAIYSQAGDYAEWD